MIPNRNYLAIAFPSVPEPVVDVWRTLASCLENEKCLPPDFYFSQITGHADGKKSENNINLNTDQISSLITERGLDGFSINTGYSKRSVAYSLMHMRESGRQSLFDCRISAIAKAPKNWAKLIESLMIQWPCIGGWQFLISYQAWQWACVFDSYEIMFGQIPPNLRTYIEKSVSPVVFPDREMIDIALNPGRIKDLLPGIYFVPSAEMWLGPHFWQYAKCTKEEALAADFFLEKRDTPHFLYLKSWPQPFSRPDGEQGRQQQRIWKLFFNEDCEWPPGSGTIYDEPMYGPPELMP